MCKVLHVCESDLLGGGSISTYRLHRGLLSEGVDSRILVHNKLSNDSTVIRHNPNRADSVKYGLSKKCNEFLIRSTGFYKQRHFVKYPGLGSGILASSQMFEWADVIHLHWVYRSMLSISDIAKISKPIVWTTKDLWSITDSVIHYYGLGDQAYLLNSIPAKPKTLIEKFVRVYKKFSWRKRKDWVVGQSEWVFNIAKSSPYFHPSRVKYVGHYINCDEWNEGDSDKARNALGFSKNDLICCFGATNIEKNRDKGLRFIVEAIKNYQQENTSQNVTFVCFGNSKIVPELNEIGVIQKGKLTQEEVKLLYQASDCMLVASRLETFCLVVQEAMACMTPCVAFPVGAIPDMITHKNGGYLAKPFEIEDFVNGMRWVLGSGRRMDEIKKEARTSIERLYDKDNTVKKYIEIYKEMAASGTAA